MSKVIDSFFDTVKEKPDEPVLSDCGAVSLSYRELDILSGRVYRYLKEKGIGREVFVMILLPRGVLPFVVMLGVWRAGAAFVAVEEGYPAERIAFIKKDCGCRLTIDTNEWEKILRMEPLSGCEQVSEHDAAFAVYTSGSTGNPKGVLHEYGNLDIIAASVTFDVVSFGLIAPTNFVASVIGYLAILLQGCSMFVLPYSVIKNPPALIDCYVKNNIHTAFCVPSVYRLFSKIPTLKVIVLSSEPTRGIWSEDPKVSIYNFYVSSETGFIASRAKLEKPNENAPIGHPNTDLKMVLRDEEGNVVPDGETGEICVENPYVRGYINLPEQNARAFINGEYRTADLGKINEDGEFVVVGRADDMVKINGNRVEPGEVEVAARRRLGLSEVMARGFTDGEDAFICLYYTDDIELDAGKAREALIKVLPYYMIPAHFMHIDSLPRTANGKVSRRMLPKPEIGSKEDTYAEPKTPEEKALCDAMAKILSVSRVGARDDFYTLGGSSILAMELIGSCDLPELNVTQIFRGRTPEKIAALYLEERMPDIGLSRNESIKRAMTRSYPLTYEQLYMFDYQLYTPKSTMLNIAGMLRFNEKLDAERLKASINAMIQSHPALLTSLSYNEDGEVVQHYTPEQFSPVEIEEISEDEIEELADTLVHPFEGLMGKTLVRNRLFQTEEALYWFYEIHHMFFDGASGKIMIKEVCDLYLDKEYPAPKEPDGYYFMLYEREHQKLSEQYAKSREYFENRYGGTDWSIRLDCEMESRKNGYGEQEMLLDLPEDEFKELEEVSNLGKNGIYMISELLAMAAMNGKKDVMTVWVYKGRDSRNLTDILGLLFRELPVALSLSPDMTLGEIYSDVAEQISSGIAHCDYPYIDKGSAVKTNDHFIFIYQENNWNCANEMPLDMEEVDIDFPDIASETAMDVEIIDTDEGTLLFLEYSDDRYRDEDVKQFMDTMLSIDRAMLSFRKHPEATLGELFKEAGLPFPG